MAKTTKNKSYWEQRYLRNADESFQRAEMTDEEIRAAYQRAIRRLQKAIDSWYRRFAKENGITLAEARRLLDANEMDAFKMDLQEFMEQAQRENLSEEHMKMLENASVRKRLTREQELYISVVHELERLSASQQQVLADTLNDVYETATYKTAFTVQSQKGEFSVLRHVDPKRVSAVTNSEWASDGKDFSSRIWGNTQKLVKTLQNDFTQGFILGQGADEMATNVSKHMGVSYSNARRLVDTEVARVHQQAFIDTVKELDVEQLEILATLDSKTSAICRHLDGHKIKVSDAKTGVTVPPFHCNCRSTTVPYIAGLELEGETRTARNADTGKSESVGGDLSYEEWYNKYVKNESLIGLTTSNGITISALSEHQQERADERRLDEQGIVDALENPLHVADVVVKDDKRSQRFIGEQVTVNVNPDTGVIITSWATGKASRKKYQRGDDDES